MDSKPHLLYFYSTFAQVAGALVGLIVVAFTFNAKPGTFPRHRAGTQEDATEPAVAEGDAENARHDSRLTFAGIALLMAVVLASGLVLFFDGNEFSVYGSRALLSGILFEVTGGVTYHRLWADGWPLGSPEYRRQQIQGRWLTGLTGVAAVLVSVVLLPEVFHRVTLGAEDLVLAMVPLVGGTIFAFYVFVHALTDASPNVPRPNTGESANLTVSDQAAAGETNDSEDKGTLSRAAPPGRLQNQRSRIAGRKRRQAEPKPARRTRRNQTRRD